MSQETLKQSTLAQHPDGLLPLTLTAKQASFIATLLPLRYSIHPTTNRRGRPKRTTANTLTTTLLSPITAKHKDEFKQRNSSSPISQIDGKSKSDHPSQKEQDTFQSIDENKNSQIPEPHLHEGLLEIIIQKFLEEVSQNEEIQKYLGHQFANVKTKMENKHYTNFISFQNDVSNILQRFSQNDERQELKEKFTIQIFQNFEELKAVYQEISSKQNSTSSQLSSTKEQKTQEENNQTGGYRSKRKSKSYKANKKNIEKEYSTAGKKGCQIIPNEQGQPSNKNLFAVEQQNESQTNQQRQINCETAIYIHKLLSKLHRHDQEDLLKTISSEYPGRSALIKNINHRQAISFIKRLKLTLQKYGIRHSDIETNAEPAQSSFQIQSQHEN